MKNPKYWASLSVQNYICPDNVNNLNNCVNKGLITDGQKETLQLLTQEYVKQVEKILKDK